MALRSVSVVVFCAALLGACGDHASSDGEDAAVDAGGTAGKAGHGGEGGTGGGGGGTGGDAGGGAGEPIMCAKLECKPPQLKLPDDFTYMGAKITPALIEAAGYGPENCCAGKKKDACGVTQSLLISDGTCLERDQKGRPAPEAECPSANATIMGQALLQKGCCRPDNKCGVDLDILGVGCLENSEASRIQGMGAATMIDASISDLESKACDYGSPPPDGGADDAGN